MAPTSYISEAKSDGRERWGKSPGGPEGPFPVEPELIGVGMGGVISNQVSQRHVGDVTRQVLGEKEQRTPSPRPQPAVGFDSQPKGYAVTWT